MRLTGAGAAAGPAPAAAAGAGGASEGADTRSSSTSATATAPVPLSAGTHTAVLTRASTDPGPAGAATGTAGAAASAAAGPGTAAAGAGSGTSSLPPTVSPPRFRSVVHRATRFTTTLPAAEILARLAGVCGSAGPRLACLHADDPLLAGRGAGVDGVSAGVAGAGGVVLSAEASPAARLMERVLVTWPEHHLEVLWVAPQPRQGPREQAAAADGAGTTAGCAAAVASDAAALADASTPLSGGAAIHVASIQVYLMVRHGCSDARPSAPGATAGRSAAVPEVVHPRDSTAPAMAAVAGSHPAAPAADDSLSLAGDEACPGEHARGASEDAVVVQLAEGIPSLEHLASDGSAQRQHLDSGAITAETSAPAAGAAAAAGTIFASTVASGDDAFVSERIRPSGPTIVAPAASVHLVEVLRGSGIDTFQFRRWYDSVLAALARL